MSPFAMWWWKAPLLSDLVAKKISEPVGFKGRNLGVPCNDWLLKCWLNWKLPIIIYLINDMLVKSPLSHVACFLHPQQFKFSLSRSCFGPYWFWCDAWISGWQMVPAWCNVSRSSGSLRRTVGKGQCLHDFFCHRKMETLGDSAKMIRDVTGSHSKLWKQKGVVPYLSSLTSTPHVRLELFHMWSAPAEKSAPGLSFAWQQWGGNCPVRAGEAGTKKIKSLGNPLGCRW